MAQDKERERARDEFLAESQELIESISRDLLILDEGQKQGNKNPETLNDLFRGMHTLKGLSGMFGLDRLARLSHILEDLLEDLRLGRIEMNQQVLDVLFEGTESFSRLLGDSGSAGESAVDIESFSTRVRGLARAKAAANNILDDYAFDASMLGVLTEYEEHRLRTNLEQGFAVYRLRVRLSLDVIDTALDQLKERMKGVAEIITYLPSMEGAGGDSIEIEMLLATKKTETDLRVALNRPDASLAVVLKKKVGLDLPPATPTQAGRVEETVPPSAGGGAPAAAQGGGRRAGDAPGQRGPKRPRGGPSRPLGDSLGPAAGPISARPDDAAGAGSGGDPARRSASLAESLAPGAERAQPRAAQSAAAQRAERASVERPSEVESTKRPQPANDGVDMSLRSLTNVVRVDIRKLDHLMNVVGELGTVRASLARLLDRMRATMPAAVGTEVHRIHRAFQRHLAEVQEGVLDIRMVPLAQLFDKLAVIVRQVAREQKKDVRLMITGAETEVDKLIAEELADPMMHIVRNAIDHGVEAAGVRSNIGKPASATLAVNAYQKGNHVVIELADDGRGIDPMLIREAAVRKGVMSESAVADLTREELLQVIFLPGFSTASAITDISGRGVGMDVVKTNITRLGGAVDIESEVSVGTKVTITLPITLAIINALLFEVRGKLFAIPLAVVQEALRLPASALRTVEGREVMTLRGSTLPLCRLAQLFRLGEPEPGATENFVIVITVGNRRIGLCVERLAGQQDVVIKGLGKSLVRVQGISGATDLGDQRLVLVLDAASIMEEVLQGRSPALVAGGVQ